MVFKKRISIVDMLFGIYLKRKKRQSLQWASLCICEFIPPEQDPNRCYRLQIVSIVRL